MRRPSLAGDVALLIAICFLWFLHTTPREHAPEPITKRSTIEQVERHFSLGGSDNGMDYTAGHAIPGAQTFEYQGKGWTAVLTVERPGVSHAPPGRRWVP